MYKALNVTSKLIATLMNNWKGYLNWSYHLLQKLLQLLCRLVEFSFKLSVVLQVAGVVAACPWKHMEAEMTIAELCIMWKERHLKDNSASNRSLHSLAFLDPWVILWFYEIFLCYQSIEKDLEFLLWKSRVKLSYIELPVKVFIGTSFTLSFSVDN